MTAGSPDLVRPNRALFSVSDKTGLVQRAQALSERGVALIASGGTYKALVDAGLPATEVSELTGFPEIMDGRVKTLHPKVHGGLLAKRDAPSHVEAMSAQGISAIDILMVNLYPFEDTRADTQDFSVLLENIDIGGPALLRAAAKNHAWVTACSDGADLDAVLAAMDAHGGGIPLDLRRRLAAKVYARTAAYDAVIAQWLREDITANANTSSAEEDAAPTPGPYESAGGRRAFPLRYGENPHQAAGLYLSGEPRPGVARARQMQGKALSYNNINDTDAAYELVAEFPPEDGPAVVIVKHANPCGVARADSLAQAYQAAFDADRVSAFGGIVSVNQKLDADIARAILDVFTEVVIAPNAEDEALELLSQRQNLRVMLADALPDPTAAGRHVRSVAGGILLQDRDAGAITADDVTVVTQRAPSAGERADALFAWRVAKHVKSNAIVYVKDGATAGVGAGQMSRVDAARIAARKAEDAAAAAGWDTPRTQGSACASDAFFPFPDGVMEAAAAGATCIIQPGGSVRDEAVIAAADQAGLAMMFTGMRHFRH